MLNLDSFRAEFLRRTAAWSWEIEGFLDTQGYVHPIDTDTKVISTVFERLASPVIRTIARENGYTVETANQTTYPDFTMSKMDGSRVSDRVAIDIKTTYVSNAMVLTLGGYNSFLRSPTKNILYPYGSYTSHWIIGFIYAQNPKFTEYDLMSMPKRGDIKCPYKDVTVFIREKHAISGLRAGSGNTKNIGSVKVSRPQDFGTVAGPFTQFRDAKGACDHYWRGYEGYVTRIFTPSDLLNHADFRQFR